MKKPQPVTRNIVLQTAYQILNVCTPIITTPFLARALGAEKLGVFSYTGSIVAYFALIAMLGTVNYGTRTLAACNGDKTKRSHTFLSIYCLQLLSSFIAIALYSLYLLLFCKENVLIATIQMISVVGCLFNVNWLYYGMEDFRSEVIVNFAVKIATVISLLTFVKTPDDLWKYTVIMLGGTMLDHVILWIRAPRFLEKCKVKFTDVTSHLRPNLILFLPLLALSVYHTMDKTMLGWLSTYEQSGFYYSADKVINIPLSILIGIGTVMLPHMTSLYANSDFQKAKDVFLCFLDGISALTIAMSFGIAAVAPDFIRLFYGGGYEPCILLTIVFAPILTIKSILSTIQTQYLIPLGKEKTFTQSVVIGAVVNLVFNLMLIRPFGALGAVIATLLAELSACIYQMVSIRKEIDLGAFFRKTVFYVAIGAIMLVAVRLVTYPIASRWASLFLGMGVGVVVFACPCLLFWKKTNNPILGMLKNKKS